MIGDSIGAAVGAEKQRKQAEKEARKAVADRERALAMAADANYEPFLVSDIIDPYQRSQSPVARGYLESFMTGANPQAVQGVRAGNRPQLAAAQQNFNQGYGGWDALRAKQREMEQSTPWDVKPFKEAAVNDEMRWKAKLGQGGQMAMQRLGLSYDDLAALERSGLTVGARNGEIEGLSKEAKAEATALNRMDNDPKHKGLIEELLRSARTGRTNSQGKTAQTLWNNR